MDLVSVSVNLAHPMTAREFELMATVEYGTLTFVGSMMAIYLIQLYAAYALSHEDSMAADDRWAPKCLNSKSVCLELTMMAKTTVKKLAKKLADGKCPMVRDSSEALDGRLLKTIENFCLVLLVIKHRLMSSIYK